jgi:hypothetical protein
MDVMGVKAGDSVFVTGIGWGQVSRVMDGGFMVKIGGSEKLFGSDGKIGGRGLRRVYWADPAVVEPPRNLRLWRSYAQVAAALWESLESLHKDGLLPDEPEP